MSTAGTWRAQKWSSHASTTVVVDDPEHNVTGIRVIAECESEDDARLCAASKDLLAALKGLLAVHLGPKLSDEGPSYRAVRAARAAITRASA